MAVSFVALPDPAFEAILEYARRVPEITALVLGHEMYQLGLDQLAAGGTLADTRRAATRFVVEHQQAPIAVIDASVARKDGRIAILGLLGASAARDLHATALAIDETRYAKRAYEFRVLQLPALAVSAIWLHARTEDVLFPFGAALDPKLKGPLEPGPFFTSMRRLARKRIAAEAKLGEVTVDEKVRTRSSPRRVRRRR
jgi:hypothetical protein